MFASGPIPECLVREVASTPTAFERDLRKAWPAGVDSQGEGIFRLVDGELMLEVAIVPAGVDEEVGEGRVRLVGALRRQHHFKSGHQMQKLTSEREGQVQHNCTLLWACVNPWAVCGLSVASLSYPLTLVQDSLHAQACHTHSQASQNSIRTKASC